MIYVISKTGAPFQFNLGPVTYSFDTEEPTAISDAHYAAIVERIGQLCLTEVDAPEETEDKTSQEGDKTKEEAQTQEKIEGETQVKASPLQKKD